MIESPASFECADTENLDMVSLRRFFKLFFDGVFSTSDNYGRHKESLKCFVLGDDLSVELDQILDPGKEAQYKPTINVGFGDMQFSHPVINYEGYPSEDMATGNYTAPAKVPMVVHHVMPYSDASHQLSDITFQALFGLRPWIMKRLGLRAFMLNQISRARKLASSPDPFFTVDVSCLLEFNYNMQTTIQGHRLKKVFLEPLT